MTDRFSGLAWRSEDAARWSAQRSPRWAEPDVSAAVLTLLFAVLVTAFGTAPLARPGWVGVAALGLFFELAVWLVTLPELVVLGAPVLVALAAVAARQGNAGSFAPYAIVPFLVFVVAAACRRLLARRRQRLAAEQAARLWRRVPAGLDPLRRGTLPILLGLLLCVVAALTVGAPSSITTRQAAVAIMAAPGLALLTRGSASRLRARAVRRKAVPVLLVGLRGGDTVTPARFYAGDDYALESELFRGSTYPERSRDRAALLFGAPRIGGELVLVTASGVACSARPLRAPSRVQAHPAPLPRHPGGEDVDAAAAAMLPTAIPLSWGPSRGSRLAGLLLALLTLVVTTVGANWPSAGGIPLIWLLLFVARLGLGAAARLMAWRITADRIGLRLSFPWRTRRVAWAELTSVGLAPDGELCIAARSVRWSTGSLNSRRLARRLSIHSGLEEVAVTLLALKQRPDLRPTDEAPPRPRCLPFIPSPASRH